MFDICVIGHVTKDIIKVDNREREMPGGTAYYLPIALKNLGMNISVITKISKEEISFLDALKRENIPIFLRETPRTTIFINIYLGELDNREQWVRDIALPFTAEDVEGIDSRLFHLGPLTKGDIPPGILRSLPERAKISLDVQGFLRNIEGSSREGGKVTLTDWEGKDEVLPFVTILKANEEEARILSGEKDLKGMALKLSRYGPKEVIITCGSKGSLIYSKGKFYSIPSFPSRKLVDPTGCGDTYMAGYLYKRLKSSDINESGRFAAAMASLNLEESGPFKGSEEDVQNFLEFQSIKNEFQSIKNEGTFAHDFI